jgi:NADH:ubiquinone oxidoreductase subunit 6 (subunit J)
MFIVISLITLIGAVYTVLVRNLFHAALGLIVALAGVAALYALMEASFLAAAQILIYIGAIAILIIFAVMVTRGVMGKFAPANDQAGYAVVVAGVALDILLVTLIRINVPQSVADRMLVYIGVIEALIVFMVAVAHFVMGRFAFLSLQAGVVIVAEGVLDLMLAIWVRKSFPQIVASQTLAYVIGAIAILIIVAVVIARLVAGRFPPPNGQRRYTVNAIIVAAGLLGILPVMLFRFNWPQAAPAAVPADNIAQLGTALVDPNLYALPFEVASVLLVAALIGSIYVARESRQGD